MGMKIYTNDLVKGHSDFKVKCLTFGLYTQVSDSGPLGPLVYSFYEGLIVIENWAYHGSQLKLYPRTAFSFIPFPLLF